jgi:GTP-binding protein
MAILDAVYDLFIDLDASDAQLEFPYLYAIGRNGVAQPTPDEDGGDLKPLFELILDAIPAPAYDPKSPFQMLVSDLGYSDYLGRLAVGRVVNGRVRANDSLVCVGQGGAEIPLRVSRLQTYEGPSLKAVDAAEAGDIIVLSGIEKVQIGDTICNREQPIALRRITVDEPTVSMRFTINSSPFSGREGRFVQSGKIRERLLKETLRNVAIQVEETDNREVFLVKGRGEFQMAILIETMRREGFELSVGRPEVIYKL